MPTPRSPFSFLVPNKQWMTTRKTRYLLESLVEVSLLEQLKDVSLLGLEIHVSRGDGCPGCRAHCLDNARGDSCLLLLHSQAHFSFNDSLHLGQNRLLHAEKNKTEPMGTSESEELRDNTAQSLYQRESTGWFAYCSVAPKGFIQIDQRHRQPCGQHHAVPGHTWKMLGFCAGK